MSKWAEDTVGVFPAGDISVLLKEVPSSTIASKELFWAYHKSMGRAYPGIEYGTNCPPPPWLEAAPPKKACTCDLYDVRDMLTADTKCLCCGAAPFTLCTHTEPGRTGGCSRHYTPGTSPENKP